MPQIRPCSQRRMDKLLAQSGPNESQFGHLTEHGSRGQCSLCPPSRGARSPLRAVPTSSSGGGRALGAGRSRIADGKLASAPGRDRPRAARRARRPRRTRPARGSRCQLIATASRASATNGLEVRRPRRSARSARRPQRARGRRAGAGARRGATGTTCARPGSATAGTVRSSLDLEAATSARRSSRRTARPASSRGSRASARATPASAAALWSDPVLTDSGFG